MADFKLIDMHCDTLTESEERGEGLRDNGLHLSFTKMREGNYLLQCFAIFLDRVKTARLWDICLHFVDRFDRAMAENADLIAPVTDAAQIAENEKRGQMSALLTVEDGSMIEGRLENLQTLFDRGVRLMTLTWNYENEIGFPNDVMRSDPRPDVVHGLKPFGFAVVEKMQSLGMLVDVSHLGDAGFYDVMDAAEKPVVASHSNARAVCGVPRNMTDDMIRKLRDNGGVMGLNYCPAFVSDKPRENQIPALVRHLRHIVRVGGIETAAIGGDFDGIPTPVGMSDCTKTHLLCQALRDEGFSQDDIDLIFYKNFLRVFAAQERGRHGTD